MSMDDVYTKLNITNSFYSKFVKRFLDFSLSFSAIIILSAVLIVLYILTFLFLGRPVIYKQLRPGKDHKTFNIYKFRSMNNKKDKDGNLLPDSQRITLFGKFLRKTSLDELPQLFNILKGDMSFVGPRPRLVKDMMFYDKNVYDFYVLRPGLTGITQVSGRNSNTWEQVFEKDIAYAQHITFWGDVKIFFKTFTSIFKDSGETHSAAEEDKPAVHEYYYADYCLRTQKITEEQYEYGLKLSQEVSKSKTLVVYHPEVLDANLFAQLAENSNDEIAQNEASDPLDEVVVSA